MPHERAILHVDMDAFFAAVEQLDHPELRGKPVLIGSDRPRSVVATASYEARQFGCHSAMPMVIAKQRCPQAIIMPARGKRYREVSQQLFEIFHEFSPQVEPLSIDEAFIDVTGCLRLLGSPIDIAKSIQQRIRDQLQLTASVGIATNKFLAKIASDMNKPDGLTIVTDRDLQPDGWFSKLPIEKIWGIGKVSANRLHQHNIYIIGDIRLLSPNKLKQVFGNNAEHFHQLACGIDNRPVHSDGGAKSISHEVTFEQDIADPDQVRDVLLGLVEQVSWRLRRHQLKTKSLSIKIRYGDFQTITRSIALSVPTDTTAVIWQHIKTLYDKWANHSFKPVRLIGAAADRLTDQPEQLGLFCGQQDQRQKKLDQTADQIIAKFGKGAIKRGGAGQK